MLSHSTECSWTSSSSNVNGIKYVKQSVLVGLIVFIGVDTLLHCQINSSAMLLFVFFFVILQVTMLEFVWFKKGDYLVVFMKTPDAQIIRDFDLMEEIWYIIEIWMLVH